MIDDPNLVEKAAVSFIALILFFPFFIAGTIVLFLGNYNAGMILILLSVAVVIGGTVLNDRSDKRVAHEQPSEEGS